MEPFSSTPEHPIKTKDTKLIINVLIANFIYYSFRLGGTLLFLLIVGDQFYSQVVPKNVKKAKRSAVLTTKFPSKSPRHGSVQLKLQLPSSTFATVS